MKFCVYDIVYCLKIHDLFDKFIMKLFSKTKTYLSFKVYTKALIKSCNHFRNKGNQYTGVRLLINRRMAPYMTTYKAISDKVAYIIFNINKPTNIKVNNV